MRSFVKLLGLLSVFCLASSVNAQPWTRVRVFNDTTISGCTACTAPACDQIFSGTSPRSISLPQCAKQVVIYSCNEDGTLGPVTDMPRITLTGGPVSLPVDVVLGFASPSASDPTPAGANWGGLDASSLTISKFYGGITGNLTGQVRVDQLFRFDVEGSIQAEVRAGGAGNGGTFIVEAASVASNGSIVLETNNIGRVTVGSHAGLIEAVAGSISIIEVSGTSQAVSTPRTARSAT